jgi:hypothetical protein
MHSQQWNKVRVSKQLQEKEATATCRMASVGPEASLNIARKREPEAPAEGNLYNLRERFKIPK